MSLTWNFPGWKNIVASPLVSGVEEVKEQQVVVVFAARDYCQWDTFEASCPSRDQLVVMKSAVYGRMASGRCIERDYGYVGCQSDVLLQADTRCSGRRECKLDIPYRPFDVGHPCPKDLTRFLRASFVCLKGKIPFLIFFFSDLYDLTTKNLFVNFALRTTAIHVFNRPCYFLVVWCTSVFYVFYFFMAAAK